jgi:hypothetical protein
MGNIVLGIYNGGFFAGKLATSRVNIASSGAANIYDHSFAFEEG